MHPCPGNWVAIGHMAMYYGSVFSAGMKCTVVTWTYFIAVVPALVSPITEQTPIHAPVIGTTVAGEVTISQTQIANWKWSRKIKIMSRLLKQRKIVWPEKNSEKLCKCITERTSRTTLFVNK